MPFVTLSQTPDAGEYSDLSLDIEVRAYLQASASFQRDPESLGLAPAADVSRHAVGKYATNLRARAEIAARQRSVLAIEEPGKAHARPRKDAYAV
jgi:hypothetical protein